jgi:hypothetical protein
MRHARSRRTLACVLLVLGLVVDAPAPSVAAEAFVSSVEDLPLMPGLSEDKPAGLAFDSAGGRIVEAFATGTVSEDEVLRFYGETLPQLGWTTEAPALFHRGGETLRLDFQKDAKGLTVHYYLSPR